MGCLETQSAAADTGGSTVQSASNAYNIDTAKWGEKAYGTGSGTITWSFAIPASGTRWNYDARITDAGQQDAVERAFEAWEAVANIDFVEVQNGAQADLIIGLDFIDGRSGTVGQAYYQSSGFGSLSRPSEIVNAEIRFDTGENWATGFGDRQDKLHAVAVHEIGHILGMGHFSDPNQIMNPFVTSRTTLGEGDIAGIQELYGRAVGTPDEPDNPEVSVVTGTRSGETLDRAASSAPVTIYGLDGNDTVRGGSAADRLYGGRGNDETSGNGGADILIDPFGNDTANGGGDGDVIADFSGNNTLNGGSGGDLILGGYDNDRISGGAGNDVLVGDAFGRLQYGEDFIDGGAGNDLMSGGKGRDVFYFETNDGSDTIGRIDYDTGNIGASRVVGSDFEIGVDMVHLDGFSLPGGQSVEDRISQSGNDAVFSLQGTTIRFENTDADDLSASDFLFL